MTVPFFIPWSRNLLTQATSLAVVAGEDSEFPIENVIDGNPAWPAKNTGTTIRITAGFAAPVAVDTAAAIHHTLGDATVLRIQGHTSDSWGAPDINVAFPARTAQGGEYRENALVTFDQASKQWWSFTVPSANAVAIWFGQLWLGARTEFHDDFRYDGNNDDLLMSVIENVTAAEVSLRLKQGFVRAIVEGTIRAQYADTLQYLQMFNDLSGMSEPMLVVADPAHPIALMALLDQPSMRRALADIDAYDLTLRFRELSKGLAFPLT